MGDPMIVRKRVYNPETKTWEQTDEWVDLNKVNVFDQDRMENWADDTEGGYTVTESKTLTPEQEESYDRLATELGRDCPDPDCICKKGTNG